MMVIYGKIVLNAAEKRYNFAGETNFLHRTGIYSLCAVQEVRDAFRAVIDGCLAVQDAGGAKEIPNSWLSYTNSMV